MDPLEIVKLEYDQSADSDTESEGGPGDVVASSESMPRIKIEHLMAQEGAESGFPVNLLQNVIGDSSTRTACHFAEDSTEGSGELTAPLPSANAVSSSPTASGSRPVEQVTPKRRPVKPEPDLNAAWLAHDAEEERRSVRRAYYKELRKPSAWLEYEPNASNTSQGSPMDTSSPIPKQESKLEVAAIKLVTLDAEEDHPAPMVFDTPPIKMEVDDSATAEPNLHQGDYHFHDDAESLALVPFATHFLLESSHPCRMRALEAGRTSPSNTTSNSSQGTTVSSSMQASIGSSAYLSQESNNSNAASSSDVSSSFIACPAEAFQLLNKATSSLVVSQLTPGDILMFINKLQSHLPTCSRSQPTTSGSSSDSNGSSASGSNGRSGTNAAESHECVQCVGMAPFSIIKCLKRVQHGPRCEFECMTYTQLMEHRMSLHNELPAANEYDIFRGSLRSQIMYRCTKTNAWHRRCGKLALDQLDLVQHGVTHVHKKEVHFLRLHCYTCKQCFTSRDETLTHFLRYQDKCKK